MKENNNLWSDDELRVAIETYLYILRLQESGIPYSLSSLSAFLMFGPLKGRNDASIRYRMRNISDVFQKKGLPTIIYYSPAPQVGAGVRKRIENILNTIPEAFPLIQKPAGKLSVPNESQSNVRKVAIGKLEDLYKTLCALERNPTGIGHNNPPGPIDDFSFDPAATATAIDYVLAIKEELDNVIPDTERVKEKADGLLEYGLKLALWTGERITKFSDSVLVSAGKVLGPVLVVQMTGILPKVLETVHAVAKLISSFH